MVSKFTILQCSNVEIYIIKLEIPYRFLLKKLDSKRIGLTYRILIGCCETYESYCVWINHRPPPLWALWVTVSSQVFSMCVCAASPPRDISWPAGVVIGSAVGWSGVVRIKCAWVAAVAATDTNRRRWPTQARVAYSGYSGGVRSRNQYRRRHGRRRAANPSVFDRTAPRRRRHVAPHPCPTIPPRLVFVCTSTCAYIYRMDFWPMRKQDRKEVQVYTMFWGLHGWYHGTGWGKKKTAHAKYIKGIVEGWKRRRTSV